jgi:hypothetical protein
MHTEKRSAYCAREGQWQSRTSVAVEDWRVTGTNLTRVVHDDDLGVEGGGLHGRVVLGVTGDVATANVLDRDVLDVEADVVSRETFRERLVVHLDRLDFSGDVGRGKGDNHTGLDDTSLDTADRNRANTANLVHVLERKTEGLVGRARRRDDGVNGLEQGLARVLGALDLLLPTLVPGHVSGSLDHVVTVPARDGDKGNFLGVVADPKVKALVSIRSSIALLRGYSLLDEGRGLLDDLVEAVLGPLGGVHLVDGNDELTDTKGEGEKGVLAGLAILGDTGLEFTSATSNNEDSAVGLKEAGSDDFHRICLANVLTWEVPVIMFLIKSR